MTRSSAIPGLTSASVEVTKQTRDLNEGQQPSLDTVQQRIRIRIPIGLFALGGRNMHGKPAQEITDGSADLVVGGITCPEVHGTRAATLGMLPRADDPCSSPSAINRPAQVPRSSNS